MAKPLLEGSRARALFGDMADLVMVIVEHTSESLVRLVNDEDSKAVAAISAALKDGMRLERILNLLEAGQVEAAEKMLLEHKTKGK